MIETSTFGILQWSLSFIVFLGFWFSLLGLGAAWISWGIQAWPQDAEGLDTNSVSLRSFAFRWMLSLYLGSITLSLVWSVMPARWFGIAILGIGLALCMACKDILITGARKAFLTQKLVVFALAIFFVIRFLPSLKLNVHGDVFGYHLLAPRFWWDHQSIAFNPGIPPLFCASYWEYLLGWGHLLFAGDPNSVNGSQGLIAAHAFGQWLSFFVGYLGSGCVAYWLVDSIFVDSNFRSSSIFKFFVRYKKAWSVLAVIAVLSVRTVRDFGTLAKNDWGTLFWALVPMIILLKVSRKNLAHIPTAVLFGLGCGIGFSAAAKFTLIPSLLAFVIVWIWVARPKLFSLGIITLGSLLGALPIFLRNVFATGNPFFPAMGKLFFSPQLSESYLSIMAPVESSSWIVAANSYRADFISQGPMAFIGLIFGFMVVGILFFLTFHFKKRNQNQTSSYESCILILSLWSTAILGSVIFIAKGVYEIRYGALSLIIFSLLGVIAIAFLIVLVHQSTLGEKLPLKVFSIFHKFSKQSATKIELAALVVSIVIVFATSGLPLHLVLKIAQGSWPSAQQIVENEILSGPVFTWARANIAPGSKILTTHIELYYASQFNASQPQLHPKLDAVIRAELGSPNKNPELRILKYLISEGYRYYFDMKFGYGSDFTLGPVIEKLIQKESVLLQKSLISKVVIYTAPDSVSRVIDLVELNSRLN